MSRRLSRREWAALVMAWNYRCAYCRDVAQLTADHVEPLARGGFDSRSNIVPACERCNQAKGSLFLLEWIALRAGLLRFANGRPNRRSLRVVA